MALVGNLRFGSLLINGMPVGALLTGSLDIKAEEIAFASFLLPNSQAEPFLFEVFAQGLRLLPDWKTVPD